MKEKGKEMGKEKKIRSERGKEKKGGKKREENPKPAMSHNKLGE